MTKEKTLKENKKKLLFSATLREIRYLLENDYLNEKGKEWANFLVSNELEEDLKNE